MPSQPSFDPITVDIPEASRVSGFGQRMLYKFIKDGDIKSVLIGRKRLIIYASLRSFLTDRVSTAA